jgi:type II secretory pathway predicted ATPase ExeA
MYHHFYYLNHPPFPSQPDLSSLFVSSHQQAAVEYICNGIAARQGLLVLIGTDGVGKTTLLRADLARIERKRCKTIYLPDPNLPFGEVLHQIYRALGLKARAQSRSEMVSDLYKILTKLYELSINLVIVVDNAEYIHLLNLRYLMILNQLKACSHNLIQVVLVGNKSLKMDFDRNFPFYIKKEISVISYISPLEKEESYRYIHYHIENAKIRGEKIFTKRALKHIVQYGGGIPKRLNTVCTAALMEGYWSQQKPITAKIVRRAIAQIELMPSGRCGPVYRGPRW